VRYCIIGNGAAGADTALSIRQNDPEGEILLLSESAHPHYYRPKLIDYIMEDLPAEKLYILRNEALAAKKIGVRLSTRIDSVDPAVKTITTHDHEIISYDKLMLAVGSTPFLPPMEGMPMEGVFTLRDIEDADKIKAWCRGKKNIVISGAGLLGLETANAIRGLCEKITVIDMSSCLLSRQLDGDGAALLQGFLEKKGMSFIFDDCVTSLSGNGCLEHLNLRSGRQIPADALIVSAGVKPNVGLAQKAGLVTGRGIIVDSHFQTSDPSIYAAGDCAEFENRCYGLWTVSKEQGRIAGANMAGVVTEYKGSVPSAMLKVTGIDLYSAGDYMGTTAWSMMKLEDHRYLKIVYADDRPVGAIVIGDAEAVKLAQKVMTGKAALEDFKKLMS
jgi:nitrite reductase (NADH) large subunit